MSVEPGGAMRRQGWRWLLIGLTGLLVMGCFGPQGPQFGDGSAVPEEASRVRLPVSPGPDGTWVVNSPREGLLGQGGVLVRREGPDRRGWRLALPTEFTLTSPRPGSAHSALVQDHWVVLVGGREGHEGPSTIAGLDLEKGRLAWRRPLAPGSQVFLYDYGAAAVLVANCRTGSCHLTGYSQYGQRVWSRTEPGAVKVLDGCRADAFTTEPPAGDRNCHAFLVTPDRIATLDMDNGRPHWHARFQIPRGSIDRITEDNDLIILATAPAEGSCGATVLAGPAGPAEPSGPPETGGTGELARTAEPARTPGPAGTAEPAKTTGPARTGAKSEQAGWQHTFVWDQPQAPRDPHTGCRWDRTLPLLTQFSMVLPDAEGALVVSPYFGTEGPARRLSPGEYLVTDGTFNQIVRASGRPDRNLDTSDRPVRPEGLSPAARALTRHFWQDGQRLLLLDHGNRPLWEGTSACEAFLHDGTGPHVRVTYCDGTDLVELRPVHRNN
ncbi:hypothetical protein ACF1E9_15100 [Streptomyces roseolus]|uniref:hypothetical protein n=1 Tax=Streptomyces roseolus TaxID=67358 RepID=UPI0036F7D7BE